MNAEQLLSYVRQKRVVLIPDGDRIKYKAPTGTMTPELTGAIRTHKQKILRILNQDREIKASDTPEFCQSIKRGKATWKG